MSSQIPCMRRVSLLGGGTPAILLGGGALGGGTPAKLLGGGTLGGSTPAILLGGGASTLIEGKLLGNIMATTNYYLNQTRLQEHEDVLGRVQFLQCVVSGIHAAPVCCPHNPYQLHTQHTPPVHTRLQMYAI